MDNSLKSDLDSLPPLRDIINEYELRAEKSLGQNFILDQNLTDKIVRAAGNISNLHIIEIGPGPGGLTRSILRADPQYLTAIEFDKRAIEALQSLKNISNNKMSLIHGDALKADIQSLKRDLPKAVIANLPYNIATPLLIGWLKQIRENSKSYKHMTLMFQKEVAERVISQPQTKAYGRLSVMAQWLCHCSISFDVPASAFVPPPKITSSILSVYPKELDQKQPSFDVMERVVATAFNQRRKMIRSSLKIFAEALEISGLDATQRAENLTVEDYVTLAKCVESA